MQDVKDCAVLTIAHIAGASETPFFSEPSSRDVQGQAGPVANSPTSCSAPGKTVTGRRLRREAGRPVRATRVAVYISSGRSTSTTNAGWPRTPDQGRD